MEVTLTRTIEMLIFPPGITVLLMSLGLILLRRRPTTAFLFLSFGLLLLFLASIPITATTALTSLEGHAPLTVESLRPGGAGAIVVLGGGRRYNSPEYHSDTVSWQTLERLRYGAYLNRETKLPILVSGGKPFGEDLPEAVLMKDTLQRDFHITARWIEGKSRTTYENAVYSKDILAKDGINKIYLVTHAWHMPRAVESFQKQEFQVIAAPTGFTTPGPLDQGFYAWLPRADALAATHRALHEILGRLWYRLSH